MAFEDLLAQRDRPAKASPKAKRQARSIDEAFAHLHETLASKSPLEQDFAAGILRQHVPMLQGIPLTVQERNTAAMNSRLQAIRAEQELAQYNVYEAFATMKEMRHAPMASVAGALGLGELPEGVAATDTLESYLGAGPVDELLDDSARLLHAAGRLHALTGNPAHRLNEFSLVLSGVGSGREAMQKQALDKAKADADAISTFAKTYSPKGAKGSDEAKVRAVLAELAKDAEKAVDRASGKDSDEPGEAADNAMAFRRAWQAYLQEVGERGGAGLPDHTVLSGFLDAHGSDFKDAFEEIPRIEGVVMVGQASDGMFDFVDPVTADASGVMGVLLDEWSQFSGQSPENILSETGLSVDRVDYGEGRGILDRYRAMIAAAESPDAAPSDAKDDDG